MRLPTLVTCTKGGAGVLASELRSLGYPVIREEAATVETEADWPGLYRLCLRLRTAHRVLARLAGFDAPHPDALYRAVRRLPWEEWISPDGYVRVHGFVHTPEINDERFAFYKVKDAVADRMRDRTGRRPDSGPHDHGCAIYLHWNGRDASVYLDLAGIPLSKRGYRLQGGVAPLRETLAATMLLAGGWTPEVPLVNPMCGSGTLAIEAALIARREAPGLYRDYFAVKHLRPFNPDLWQAEREAAEQDIVTDSLPPIVANDLDNHVVAAARENAKRAGVEANIEFSTCDFRDTPVPEGPSWFILNPGYGKRVGEEMDLEAHYRDIGAWLKQQSTGGRALVLSGNLPLAKRFGLKLSEKYTLYNGPLECRLLVFDLFR